MLTCMVIDDEPIAHKLLEFYCGKTGFIKVLDHCFSAREGLEILERQAPDFIFMDINMPEISGIEMLNIAQKKPRIVFTTAHSQYALEGYEYNTVDYLLKPIRYERFLKAVEKVQAIVHPNAVQLPDSIRLDSENKRIYPAEIYYVESWGNYIRLFLRQETKPLVLHKTMIAMEHLLLPYGFIRCHKKYMVNSLFVGSLMDRSCMMTDGRRIQVGISYYQKVKEYFQKKED